MRCCALGELQLGCVPAQPVGQDEKSMADGDVC